MYVIYYERFNTRMYVIAGSRLLNNNDKSVLFVCVIYYSSVLDLIFF